MERSSQPYHKEINFNLVSSNDNVKSYQPVYDKARFDVKFAWLMCPNIQGGIVNKKINLEILQIIITFEQFVLIY